MECKVGFMNTDNKETRGNSELAAEGKQQMDPGKDNKTEETIEKERQAEGSQGLHSHEAFLSRRWI